MMRATMGGPAILPPGQIDDPADPGHKAPIFSTAKGQTTPHRLVTRRTPVNFAVCCQIDLIQRENAARLPAQAFPLDQDGLYLNAIILGGIRAEQTKRMAELAEEARREEAQSIHDGLRHQHPLGY